MTCTPATACPAVRPLRPARAARRLAASAALALALGSLSACGDGSPARVDAATGSIGSGPGADHAGHSNDGDRPDRAEVAFDLFDYRFEGPEEVPAGRVRLTVTNRATQFHHLTIGRLVDGATFDQVEAAAHEGDAEAVEDLMTSMGGVNMLAAGEAGVAEVDLAEPGEYVLACFVPDRAGTSHLAHGMVRRLTVTGSPDGASKAGTGGAATAEVAATVTMQDFSYSMDQPALRSGPQTIAFTNEGTQDHEAIIVRLDPGRTGSDLLAYLSRFGAGELTEADEAPGTAIGGPGAVAPGGSTTVGLDLEPATYAIFCAIPDRAHDGTPHVAEGMYTEVVVS